MIDENYLTISAFAEKAKVSKQAIYKQIGNANSQIAPYIHRNGKQILIKISALKDLYGVEKVDSTKPTQDSTPQSTRINPNNQPIQPDSTLNIQPISTDYIDFLKAQIAELKEERTEVEQRLNATIQEKDSIIKEQSARLAELAQQVAQIADKALIATSQQQYLTAMDKAPDTTQTVESTTEHRSFWKRLFKM